MTKEKKNGKLFLQILFIGYLLLLIKLLIFKYPSCELKLVMESWSKEVVWEGIKSANFTLFRTIRMYIEHADYLNTFENLVGNFIVFVPFGYLLSLIRNKNRDVLIVVVYAFFYSLAIELFQLFSAFGVFDVDDLLLNTLGAMFGVIVYKINKKLF